ncbi:hypothetical protein OIV83_003930 [Microbotryomycetes sp. JL201]|nr:hypothetical protein OIV83_003930 [Microbotryomycetes sp. JL201]
MLASQCGMRAAARVTAWRGPSALSSTSLLAARRSSLQQAVRVLGQSRAASTAPSTHAAAPATPRRKPFWRRRPVLTAVIGVPTVVVASLGVALLCIFGYDATTYRSKHLDNVQVDPVALSPHRGGKKNLPVAEVLIDDKDDSRKKSGTKKKLVIVGGGWGSVGLLKHLDPDEWHVTVIAPDNYFLFHPLLPSATVGTVEVRSLVEPLRKVIARVSGHYIQAKAVDVDMSARLLEVEAQGQESFYVPYDRLVIACGSVNATHGVPGLEHCYQLKTVPDAQAIRRRVMENLEKACVPSTSEEERETLLNFVICGGGPTGVEFASELFDMINEDVLDYMPNLLRERVKVHIIQSRDHILNTYSEKISQYAEERFKRNEIDTILNARVKKVTPDEVVYTTKKADGSLEEHRVPSGLTLWSTGIAMNPFTQKVASLLPNQYHKKALEVDSHLRVIGAPLGTVYALGDCATIETNLVDHLLEMVDRCDEDKDGNINLQEYEKMMKIVHRRFPTTQKYAQKIRNVFDEYKRQDGTLGMNELADLFIDISKKMTNLPATAQVANQQGVYLGKKLSKIAKTGHEVAIANKVYDDPDDMLYDPFKYTHLGSLAYIGNSAVFDFGPLSFAGGLVAMYLWRSVYWSEQVSARTRVLLAIDWIKRGVFGRDLSKF